MVYRFHAKLIFQAIRVISEIMLALVVAVTVNILERENV